MPENIIASIKLPSNEIYKIRDKEARHFLNIENVTTSSPVIVNGGGAMHNSKISISISAAQLQAIADAWARYPDDLAIEFRLYIISEGGGTGSNPFCSWVVADRAVLTPVSLTTEQGVPLAGTYYVFTGTAETLDTLKSYPFTLKINTTNGSGVLDFTVGAAVDHTHGLINSDGTIDSTTVVSIPELTSDPTKAYSILVNDTVNDGLLKPTAVAFGRDDRNAFLNKDGTWSSPSEGHFYVTGTDSVAAKTTSPYNAAQWKGSNSNITALYTGLSINYTLDVTGNTTYGTVLDINELGAHPVVSHTGAPIGNTYAANAVIQLEYDATATADVYINSTEATTVTGCWKLALAQTPPYFVEGQNSIAAKTSKPYYASIWNGINPAVKALYSGLAISYKIDVAGHSTYGVVLNLNGWGEHPVVRNVNTTISTVYAVGSIVNLIYDAEQSASVYLGSGAVSVKGCWKIADYDTNTQIVYRLLQNYSHPYVDSNSGPLYRYEVCFTTPNDTIIPINSVSNKPTVYTKEFTSIPFDPFRPIYYYATTTTVAPGDSITGSALYDVYLIDARYGFNINSAGTPGVTALEANKMVYLRAKYNTLTHLATFDQDLESENYLERSSLVQDLPSTNPNTIAGNTLGPNEIYIYIYLGIASSEYAIDKAVTNFVYYWDPTTDNINVFSGIVPTNIDISTAVSVTYSELVSLKTNNNLIPGANYRITDYVTKINGTYELNGAYFHFAKSAEHSYDVVVYAIDESTLAEDAKATLHAGDTYFASANLEAWDIKYCLENDANRFAWADTTNGKGVVYYLKDEWGNEAWYDFKNTLYLRYALQSLDSNFTTLTYDANLSKYNRYGSAYTVYQIISGDTIFGGKYTLTAIENIQQALASPEVDNNYLTTYDADWYYTFDYYNNNNNQHYDLSLSQNGDACHNNKFEWCSSFTWPLVGVSAISILGLPNTVFMSNAAIASDHWIWDNTFKEHCWFNTFGDDACSNTFNAYCYNNTIGYYCESNILNQNCHNNTFENFFKKNILRDSCSSNTFGNSCGSNIFGSSCSSNIFGNYCDSNTFGHDCGSNTFGNNCYSNTFGNGCDYNVFEDYCNYNTFRDKCNSNTFGHDCNSNTFGDDCNYNIFGSNCGYNTFGKACNSNIFGYLDNINNRIGKIYYSTLENSVKYINLVAATNWGYSYTILDSVAGSASYPLIINMTPTYQSIGVKVPETYVGYRSDGTLRTWVLADSEDANNKVTTISSSSTDIQYPSAKAVYDELVDKEDTSNKVTSLSSSSTDTEYPSAKAVYDELAAKEDVANKVTSISSSSTNTEYPSAKAVYDALSGVTPTVIYTGYCSYGMGSVTQSVTLDNSKTYTDIIADIEADKNVILRITDTYMDVYDFVYTGKQNLSNEPPLVNEVSYSFTYSTTANNGYIKATIYNSIQLGVWVHPEVIDNKVTSLSSSSTDVQYPSAKVVYDNLANKLKYILITPIGGAWDSSEGTYSCTISAADYTKVNSAWSTDDFLYII